MNTPVPGLIEMLQRLVATPSVSSVSPEFDQSNRSVIDILADWLETLGFAVEVMPLPERPEKANLIATLGAGPGGLVLAGHTDTVPFDADRWRSDPFVLTEADDRLYGLGTADMKGFFPLAIEAARRFEARQLRSPLIILATADEESSMEGAEALVAAGRPRGRYAVIGEPTGLRPVRMHKGIMMEAIRLTGRSGHSSDPSLGVNALEGMHGVLGEILAWRAELQAAHRDPLFQVEVPTLNLGHIHGGDNPNRICGQCALEFDLRPLPGMDAESLRTAIRQRLAPVAEQHQVKIDLGPIFPSVPAFEQRADSELVRLAERLTGHQAEAVAFATEAPYLQQPGCQTLVLGPGDIACAHQPDEYLELARIEPTLGLLRSLIEHYCLRPAHA
jgi:acetylornithine deacetylase